MKQPITREGRRFDTVALLHLGGFVLGLAALLAGEAMAADYGSVNFNNRIIDPGGGWVAPIYGPEPGNPSLVLQGNATTNGGTQVYSGAPLLGPGYTAALYAGAGTLTDENLLVPQVTSQFRTNTNLPGYILPTVIAPFITVAPGDTVVTMQVRAWDNKGGTVTTWEQVIADPITARGSSKLFTVVPHPLPSPPVNLVGLESFSLYLPPGGTTIVEQPRDLIVPVGAAAGFSVSVISVTSASYQWLFNGNPIPGATSTTHSIQNVDYLNGGDYSVVVTASSVSQSSQVARLSVQPRIVRIESEPVLPFDVEAIRLTYESTPNRPVRIEVRSTLRDTWFNTGEFINPSVRGYFYDISGTNDQRFYRLSVGR